MNTDQRFKWKFYALLTAMILLTMLISVTMFYYFTYDHQLRQLKSQMRQAVDDKTGHLGEWMNGKKLLLEAVHVYHRNPSCFCQLPRDLLVRNGISDIYEGYEDGSFRSVTGWIPPEGFDPRKRPWFDPILHGEGMVISDPYLDLMTGEMAVSMGREVRKEDGTRGVLAADILIHAILGEIARLDFSDIGFVWILNERGVLVHHPEPAVRFRNIREVAEIAGIPEYGALGGEGEARYRFHDSLRTALFRRIPNTRWLLGVTILEDQAFRNLETLKSVYLLVSLVLAGIFVVASYLLTRILAAPLVSIIGFVKEIADGNLDRRLTIRFNKEVDALAASLNTMASQLEESFRKIGEQKAALSRYNLELEELVRERTRDIEAANVMLQDSYEALQKQAATDYLTGIANRRSFFDMASKEVARAQRETTSFCLMIADLDDFKAVNDRFGHAAGDAVLIRAAETMCDCLRGYDLLGRLGGEEFIMLLPETSREQGLLIGERIRKGIEGSPLVHEGVEIAFTASIGLVCINDCAGCLETFVTHADEALYRAKRSGKNRVVEFLENDLAQSCQAPDPFPSGSSPI